MEVECRKEREVVIRFKFEDLKDETICKINKELKRIHHPPIQKSQTFAVYSFETDGSMLKED